jgi:hypothetical protein
MSDGVTDPSDPQGPTGSGGRAGTPATEVGLVWLAVAAAALGGAAADCHPTGLSAVDVALTAALAATVTYFSSRAQRWSWLVLGGVAAASSQDAVALAFGLAALAVAFMAAVIDRWGRVLGAIVGALAVQSLLRLPTWDPQGTSAVVAAVPMIVVVISGYRASHRRVRGLALVVGGLLAVLAVGAAVAVGVVVVGQREQVQDAIDLAQDGLRAAEDGETDQAVDLLGQAEQRFVEANDAFTAPWAAASRAVPVIGQNTSALTAATEQGAALSSTAGRAVAEANVDELGFTDGVLDLDLVRGFEEPLQRSADQLAESVADLDDARSNWLAAPVQSRFDDFADDLDDAAADADVAIDAIEVAPDLFGGEGDRRYLVLFTTPAEARGLGGFVGNYAELTARDGDVEITRSGRAGRDLQPPPGAEDYVVFGPPDYVERWGIYRPGRYVQDTTLSPDFPSVAQVWEQIYPQTPGGSEIDGVILVDPYALAALMEFTGPIEVPGWPEPLTADNAADILLRQQYLAFDEARAERIDFLDDATRLTFEKLTEGDIPGPRRVIDILGPVVDEGRLSLHSIDGDEQGLFERTGMDNRFPRVDGDFLAVTLQNSGNNKIDSFLSRTIDYDVTFDPATGAITGAVTIELRNDAPAEGLPDYVIGDNNTGRSPPGTNVGLLIVYTNAQGVGATLDGEQTTVSVADELGYNTYGFFVAVPPGGIQTARLELEGVLAGGLDYDLTYAPAAPVNPDRLRVRLSPANGFEVCDPGDFELRGDRAVLVTETAEDQTWRAGLCG